MNFYIALDILQFVCVVILFILIVKSEKELKMKDKEIKGLNAELDTLKLDLASNEVHITEETLRVHTNILPCLTRIAEDCRVYKSDKLKLIELLVVLMKTIDINLLSKINVAKKYTYKEAANILINHIKTSIYVDNEIIEVLNAIYFLITKQS